MQHSAAQLSNCHTLVPGTRCTGGSIDSQMIKYLHKYTKAVANPNAGSTHRVAWPAKPFLEGYLVDISPRAIMTAKQLHLLAFCVSHACVTGGRVPRCLPALPPFPPRCAVSPVLSPLFSGLCHGPSSTCNEAPTTSSTLKRSYGEREDIHCTHHDVGNKQGSRARTGERVARADD